MKKEDNSMDYLRFKELSHTQIKGAKWGVRRFQNEDGSLTAEGRERYNTGKGVLRDTSKILGDAAKVGTGTKSKVIRKDYSKMTDSELKQKVARLNLEEQYGRLSGDDKRVRTGSEWVHEALQNTAILVGMTGTAVGIYLALKK